MLVHDANQNDNQVCQTDWIDVLVLDRVDDLSCLVYEWVTGLNRHTAEELLQSETCTSSPEACRPRSCCSNRA